MKALLTALILATSPAQAFCPQLDALFAGSTSATLPHPFDTPTKCTTALALSGQTSTHCAWPFDYRAAQAKHAFEAVIQAVSSCVDSAAQIERDQDVNHPDFYDLRLFNASGGEVGVSLKDKGGLQKTYVFLRVTPHP